MTENGRKLRNTIRRLNLIGLAVLVILFGVFGGWIAFAELAGAVIASGFLVVETNVKKVQHPTGGVVGQIFIQQGSLVELDQILIKLDDTVPKATVGIVRSQLDELAARQARLTAERDAADRVDFPDDLFARQGEKPVATAIAGETRLFEARRMARNGQRAQLRERVAQIEEEIGGLTAQRASKEREIELIAEELKGVAELFKKNLVSIMRYMSLQRDQTKLQGERGHLTSELARARGRISEIELQIIQLDQDLRTEVLKELREIEGKVVELRERLTASEDQLKRIDIRAPQAGVVHQLAVHTTGGYIAQGETIMLIVPQSDELIVEARVAPQDVDQIVVGAPVTVRIQAGNQRVSPDVAGTVKHVSPDLIREQATSTQAAQAYFNVRIVLKPESVKLLGDLRLVPGMPAESFIETGFRTPLNYLIRPLWEQVARAFRER